MTEREEPKWGKRLACGCHLGYERCIDCRAGLDPDQEKALAITLARADGEPVRTTDEQTGADDSRPDKRQARG